MANQDLGFNVFALDKASKTFIRLGERIEKLSDKLDELDRKKVEPEIDVDTDKARLAAAAIGKTLEVEGKRHSRGFFRSMFTPNQSVLMALRTGVPAALSSPIGVAGLVLGGVFAASFVSAVLSSAALGAIGAGFVGLAAVGLRENERLKDSFADLGRTASAHLKQAATPLVPTFDRALRSVRALFGEHIREPLEGIFKGVGPIVVPFAQSLARTVGNALAPLSTDEALGGIRDFFGDVSDELPRLGTIVGDFFGQFAEHGDEIGDAFGHVITVLDGIADASADVILFFTNLFNVMSDTAEAGNRAASVLDVVVDSALRRTGESAGEAQGHMGLLGKGFVEVGASIAGMVPWLFRSNEETENAAAAADSAAGATGRYADLLPTASERIQTMANRQESLRLRMEAANEEIRQAEENIRNLTTALFDSGSEALELEERQAALAEAISAAKDASDGLTGASESEAAELRNVARDSHALIEELVNQEASTKRVRGATESAREKFVQVARQLGLTKQQANALADEYGLIPEDVETQVELIGAERAKREAAEVAAALAAIKSRIVTVTINERVQRIFRPEGGGGFIPEFHSGGIIGEPRRAHSGLRLRPGEHHVIGLEGERILSRRSTAALDDFVQSMGRGGSGASKFGSDGAAAPDARVWAQQFVRALREAGLVMPRADVARQADLYGRAG